jgi:predicted DsbA family dithiol-disulfide isomerase
LSKHHSSRMWILSGGFATGLAAWYWQPYLGLKREVDIAFTPMTHLPGFRRFASGAVSAADEFDPITGLRVVPDAVGKRGAVVDAAFCRALFGDPQIPAGTVPIAYFSDFRCPYCRVLGPRLVRLEGNPDLRIRIAWHEWPILGEASSAAARAVLAAQRQGADQAFRKHLLASSFVPNSAYLTDLAERLGLDPLRLAADMSTAEVSDQIATTTELASRLRFRGTPGLVVGRTLVNGAIDDAELMTLIERERSEGPVPGCAQDNSQL